MFCLLSSPPSGLLSYSSSSLEACAIMYTQVSCYATWVYTRLQGEQENAKRIEGEVRKAVFVCHCTQLVMSCIHKGICVGFCLFSIGLCVFISALMFPLHVLCVSLSSRNKLPKPPQASRLCPFGVCFSLRSLSPSFFFLPLNLPPLINSPHFLCIAHFLPRSSQPALSPLVKCATSATLFCSSPGTLARAGQ